MTTLKNRITDMISTAIVVDLDDQNPLPGFVSVMCAKSVDVRQDIPAVFEAYSLLQHYIELLPLVRSAPMTLEPGVYVNEAAKTVVAMISVDAGTLEYVAHWLTDSIKSERVKRMPGILALPFSLEAHASREVLIPEWFAAFYVDGDTEHCVPVLTLKSITEADKRLGDWVTVALHRMARFNLPAQNALDGVRDAAQHFKFESACG